MANIINYIKENGNKSFTELPFNELDGAIFSRLSYISFDSLVGKRKYFTQKKLNLLCEKLISSCENDRFRLPEDKILVESLVSSERYSKIFVKTYMKDTNKKEVKQFSATTFINKDKSNKFLLVSFRGTDGSYTGWKEDFEMCYKDIVPAQEDSRKYIKKIVRFTLFKNIFIVGHSKGGNLAIYASTFIKPKRITAIYSYDSPGFNKDFLSKESFKNIENKINYYAPQTSIIGRLLYSEYKTTIVDSNKTLLNQHNIYNWNINGTTFVCANKYTYISNKINDSIKTNLEHMSYQEKVEFVDTLFDIVQDLTKDDMIQFGNSFFDFFRRFANILKNKNDETKKLIFSIFKPTKDTISNEKIVVSPIKNKKENIFTKLFSKKKKSKKLYLPIIDNDEK